MAPQNISLYSCAACEYTTSNLSNMNAHKRRSCGSAGFRRVVVPVAAALESGRVETTRRIRHRFNIEDYSNKILHGVVDVQDVEARIAFFTETELGLLNNAIQSQSTLFGIFKYALNRLVGYKAPPHLQSAKIVVTPKGKKYLVWKNAGKIHRNEYNQASYFDFLKSACIMFESVCITRAATVRDPMSYAKDVADYIESYMGTLPCDRFGKPVDLRDHIHGKVRNESVRDTLLGMMHDFLVIDNMSM